MLGSNAADGVHLSKIPDHLLHRVWQPGRAAWTVIVEIYWVSTQSYWFNFHITMRRQILEQHVGACWCTWSPILSLAKSAMCHASIVILTETLIAGSYSTDQLSNNCQIYSFCTLVPRPVKDWPLIQCLLLLTLDLFNIFCAASQIQWVHNSFGGVESTEKTTE